MAIIQRTDIVGTVTATLMRATETSNDSVASDTVDRLTMTFDGIVGDSHGGSTRPSDVRVKDQYEDGTPIRNVRQVTIVSEEDLAAIAKALNVDHILPAWLVANVCVSGIPAFTLISPSTRLMFSSGASLVVDAENQPCIYPGKEVAKAAPIQAKNFPVAAHNLRGITAWVEREGDIAIGDSVEVHIPPQRIWPPEN